MMARDEIIKQSQEACKAMNWKPDLGYPQFVESLEHFYHLAFAAGARAENEQCEKLCYEADKSTHPAELADAIRNRRQ